MYLSEIQIENYRCFADATISFAPKVNVIIGENNGGKTAILCALRQVFSKDMTRKLDQFDVYRGIEDFSKPPTVRITATLSSSSADTPADRALVAQWLTDLDSPWKATVTFEYFLPEEEVKAFNERTAIDPNRENFYDTIDDFLPKFVGRVYGGNPKDRLPADPEMLRKVGCQFLDALRDAEAELTSGKNQLLKTILKDQLNSTDPDPVKAFKDLAKSLKKNVKGRLDEDGLFRLVKETGAADGGKLTFEGTISEAEFLAALELYISKHGIDLPIGKNGLGYNNLVYIALVLAKMDADATESTSGQNTLIFPMLLMEEPEAHLHPALQYRLLKYLRKRIGSDGHNRQVFITTHSTQVTSACSLDEIICMAGSEDGTQPTASYPGKVFGDTEDGKESKKYVERYLDATKSSMLFARGVLLVEGLAELLVAPRLAEISGLPLEDHLVALVSVDGSTFKHFLPLFGACTGDQAKYALKRRVACLPDADPKSRKKPPPGTHEADAPSWKKCLPYQIGRSTEFEYQAVSSVNTNLTKLSADAKNIKVLWGQKTFEYDLAHANVHNVTLITEACTRAKHLRDYCQDPEGSYPQLEKILDAAKITDDLNAIPDEKARAAAKFATLYLASLLNSKGEHALELASRIKDQADAPSGITIKVPSHISDAVKWACGERGTV